MAHYAFLDDNNIVTEIIVGLDENKKIEGLNPEIWYGNFRNQVCKRTSYNGKIRGNYAGIGYKYYEQVDLFMPPKCHDEAVMNIQTAKWDCENDDHKANPF